MTLRSGLQMSWLMRKKKIQLGPDNSRSERCARILFYWFLKNAVLKLLRMCMAVANHTSHWSLFLRQPSSLQHISQTTVNTELFCFPFQCHGPGGQQGWRRYWSADQMVRVPVAFPVLLLEGGVCLHSSHVSVLEKKNCAKDKTRSWSFGLKVLSETCSIDECRSILGAWPTFIVSLIAIGICTALVEQVSCLTPRNKTFLMFHCIMFRLHVLP